MKWRILFVIAVLAGLMTGDKTIDSVMCAGLFSWIGQAAKGVVGLGSALFGGIKSGKERKKAAKALKQSQEEIDKEKAFNDILFNREYYQDFLQRSENQAALKMLRDRLKRQNEATAQTAVITGATPEATAKQKEISNEAYGNVVSSVAANSSSAKDSVMNRYLNYRRGLNLQKSGLYNQEMNLHNQSARQFANLMQNGLNTLSSSFTGDGNGNNGLADVLGSLFKK